MSTVFSHELPKFRIFPVSFFLPRPDIFSARRNVKMGNALCFQSKEYVIIIILSLLMARPFDDHYLRICNF